MRLAKPNLFQRTMLSWDQSIPYNAVHVVRVDQQAPKRSELIQAISAAVSRCGIETQPEEVVLFQAEPDDNLDSLMERELQTRFAVADSPFRFFFQEEADSFYFGLCYFHPVAGADCICWLIEDILHEWLQTPLQERIQWNPSPPPRYRSLLSRNPGRILPWLASLPGNWQATQRYACKAVKHEAPKQTALYSIELDEQQSSTLRSAAKERNTTFHDFLQALVLFELATLMPHRFLHKRRFQITVGSIMSIRHEFGDRADNLFGLFLAPFFVSHPRKEADTFSNVLDSVKEQSAQIKKGRLYLRNLIAFQAFQSFQKLFSPEKYEMVFRRSFTLPASITSFYVDRFQKKLDSLPVSDYQRTVSSTLATPLVLSVTTFQNRTIIKASYNRAVYQDHEVEILAKALQGRLSNRDFS